MTNFDDSEAEVQWLIERRKEVGEYLKNEGVTHGAIAAEPAWQVSPYVSVWAIESVESPGSVGWWAISGDMPNDYVSADRAKNPREAVEAIATLWKEAAVYMARGEQHPAFIIGSGELDEELAPMLASRADLLLEWVSDPEAWEEDE